MLLANVPLADFSLILCAECNVFSNYMLIFFLKILFKVESSSSVSSTSSSSSSSLKTEARSSSSFTKRVEFKFLKVRLGSITPLPAKSLFSVIVILISYACKSKPNMVVFPKIGKRFCNQSLHDSKPYLSPSRFHFQSIRTLLLQSASESVKIHRHSDSDSGIVEINMDRPEAKNALGKEMLRGLLNSFEAISTDSAANVLMICSSVSKVFCAGADLKERRTMNVAEVRATVNSLRTTFSFLEALQIPTIAVIEGAALGGGLEMALSCDLRICGEDAKLALPETGLAVIPGAGGTQRLPRLVGKSIAKELIFTGRKIGARDALSIGLINYCVPAGEAYSKALEVARDINQKGPVATRMAKRAIDEGLEVNMASALHVEEDCYEQTLHTNDRLEGLLAFAEKRKPLYKGE